MKKRLMNTGDAHTNTEVVRHEKETLCCGQCLLSVAVAHSMLVAIYHILNDSIKFPHLGVEYYNQFNCEHKINACLKKLKALGREDRQATANQLY